MATDDDVEVRPAGRKGLGVFAHRDVAAGDVVLRYVQGRTITRDDLPTITPWEREHLSETGIGEWEVLPAPRCYLNHSCEPNAAQLPGTVIALRPIVAGDEVTVDYRLNAYDDGDVGTMDCACEAIAAPHRVRGDFFSMPEDRQRRYLEWAPEFIRAMYRKRHP
jgi:hypothetical protein